MTLAFLQCSQPHVFSFCYEPGRKSPLGVDHVLLPPVAKIKQLFDVMASIWRPCPVIGFAMNGRGLTATEAEADRARMRDEFGLPVCDVFRHGPDELVDAVLRLKTELS